LKSASYSASFPVFSVFVNSTSSGFIWKIQGVKKVSFSSTKFTAYLVPAEPFFPANSSTNIPA